MVNLVNRGHALLDRHVDVLALAALFPRHERRHDAAVAVQAALVGPAGGRRRSGVGAAGGR